MSKAETKDELSPQMRREIKKLHRQMARDEAAGGVVPRRQSKTFAPAN